MGRDRAVAVRKRRARISIHAPAWGATVCSGFRPHVAQFQSTRPRGARREKVEGFGVRISISIHAPAWGATCADGRANPSHHISIHAPTRGATFSFMSFTFAGLFQSTRPRGARPLTKKKFTTLLDFNPRAHAGRDCCRCACQGGHWHFNPRAHAGRDTALVRRGQRRDHFNPRAHAGRDGSSRRQTTSAPDFNPRAHAGRDFRSCSSRDSCSYFNPRAHAGRDVALDRCYEEVFISIHAPTRGATKVAVAALYRPLISIHAPTRGATEGEPFTVSLVLISIHAPTRGATNNALWQLLNR